MALRLPILRGFSILGRTCSSKLTATPHGLKLAGPLLPHQSLSYLNAEIPDSRHDCLLQSTNTTTPLITFKRFKKRSSKVKAGDQEESDESDDDDVANENPLLDDDEEIEDGREVSTIQVSSTRLDSVSKTAFATTRARIEEHFYKGELLVNGQRPQKKSEEVRVGDEIDLIKNVDPDDRSKVHVKRIAILEMPLLYADLKMKIKIARWQDVVIDAPDKQ